MGTLGWSLTGLGIWAAVSLCLPVMLSLVVKPVDRNEANWYVALAWLWPLLGPLLLIALPFYLLSVYAEKLPTLEQDHDKEDAVQGRVVE